MFRNGIALLVIATAAFTSPGVASAASPYDGRWSVLIQTTRGSCDPAYRYALRIANGNVTYAGDSGFDVRGRVSGNGNVHVRVSSGASYADGHGRLSRNSGAGAWRGAGSGGVCSGRWYADRRG
jgi:hypothetical protein